MSDSAPNFDPLSRRNFLKWSGGCSALSSTAILSQLLNLQLTQCAVADTGGTEDYKALVCVFLLGGIDSFNMVAPHVQSEYDDYAAIRTDLAIPRDDLLSIPVDTSIPGTSRSLGLHPTMGAMRSLYNDGNAAIVANVGSLVFPTDKTNYGNVKLPLGLFSHSDLVRHWQTSVPQSRSQVTGWGGRMADLLNSTSSTKNDISMNLALGSLNIFQTGTEIVPYVVNNSGATTLSGYTSNNGQDRIYRRVTDQLYPSKADDPLGQLYSDLLQRTLAKTKRVSIDAAQIFNDATSADTTVQFANNSLSNQLKMVAKAIKGRQTIGHGRQIFFVSAGGWDHHSSLLANQANLLPDVSQALADFYQETVEMNVSECVTTFTASDFARTLGSNGSGSDHAWGGNHFVIGGAVKGGKVYGDYPTSLAAGNDLDLGRGRLIPTTSVDEYNAELAMWFGINNSTTLEDVLPNIRNFYSSSASTGPVGFLM